MTKPAMKKAAVSKLDQAHYEDATLYDHRYKRRQHDLAFYKKQAHGAVLELGAGSGRVTKVLSQAAKQVVALERSKSLCATLRSLKLSNVQIQCADFSTYKPAHTFDVVCAPFHVFSHVHDGVALVRLLQRIATWLGPKGRLVFDVPNPNVKMLAWPPGKTFQMGKASDGSGRRYRYSETFSWTPLSQQQLVLAQYDALDGEDEASGFVLPLLHRHYFPAELAVLLKLSGFEVLSHEGSFVGEPLDADSEEQVIVAKVRRLSKRN